MSLFDLFSNDSAEEAARQRGQGLVSGFNAAVPYYNQGTQAARDFTMEGLTRAGDAQRGGFDTARGVAYDGLNGARDAIGTGVVSSRYYADAAAAPWQTLFGQAQGGINAYGDASGANGAAGSDRARANFRTDPGYDFIMGQGIQALDRSAAARGGLQGGGLTADTLKYATGLADQSWNNYVNRLSPYFNLGTSAAGGIAGAYNNAGNTQASLWNSLAGMNNTTGNNLANIAGTQGNTLGSITGSLFGNLANTTNQNYRTIGDLANARETGIGNANASAELNNYNVGANQLNALTSAARLAAGFF